MTPGGFSGTRTSGNQDFMETLDRTTSSGMNIQGPANGVLSLLSHCGADCELSSGEIIIIQHSTGKRISLCGGDDTTFKRDIADLCTDHVLTALAARVNGEDSQRKDLQGITPKIDLHATLGAHKSNAHECLKCAAGTIHQNSQATDKWMPCTKALYIVLDDGRRTI